MLKSQHSIRKYDWGLRVWAYIGFNYSIPDLGNSPKHANVIWLSHPEDNQLCESDVTSEDSSVHLQVGRMKWIIFGKESRCSSSDVWTKVNQSIPVFKQILKTRPRIPLANHPRTLQLTCIRKHTEFHIFKRKGGVHSFLKGNLALYTTWVSSLHNVQERGHLASRKVHSRPPGRDGCTGNKCLRLLEHGKAKHYDQELAGPRLSTTEIKF